MVPMITTTGDFTKDDVQSIIELGESLPLERAKTQSREVNEAYSSTRECLVSWIKRPAAPWLYARLQAVLMRENQRWFGLDLTGIHGDLQYTVYRPGHFFDWHLDAGGEQDAQRGRKLSCSLLLGEDPETEGGDFEIMTGSPVITAERDAGRMVVFPAWTVHRVTQVTAGCRRALVVWMDGPPVR